MKVYRGTVITCDEHDTVCEFLVEDEGRIVFTGDELPEKYMGHTSVDLGQKALIPAFGDSHLHFSSYALFSSTLDVREARDFAHLSEIISGYVRDTRAKIILGFGISAYSLAEGRMVTREELDRMEQRPVMLVKYDGHAAVVNTAMQSLLPKKIKALRGWQEDSGHLYQEAFYAATDHISSKVSVISLARYMLSAVDRMAEKGISLVHPAEGVGFPLDLDVDVVRFLARGMKNPFQFRIFFQTMDIPKVIRRKLPRIGGCFATALDGCFGSCDAALNTPYANDPGNTGILFYPDEQVNDFVQQAHDKGLQVQLHAIGDAAVDQAVRAFALAQKNNPRKNHRHSIVHAFLMEEEAMETCAELGIGIAAQPSLLHCNLEPYSFLKEVLGERVEEMSPFRTMLDMGIHVSGSSDAPVTLPDPAYGIWCACNHYNSAESVSVTEALKMFTLEPAWATFDDETRGSLEPGKKADMIILDRNPLEMDRKELFRMKTEALILEGKPYSDGQGLGSLLWKGISG